MVAVPRVLRVNFRGVAVTPKTSKVVPNEGMPNSKTGGKGDLIITFEIVWPSSPVSDPAQQAAIRAALG